MNNKVSIEYAFTPTSLVNIKMWNDKLHSKGIQKFYDYLKGVYGSNRN